MRASTFCALATAAVILAFAGRYAWENETPARAQSSADQTEQQNCAQFSSQQEAQAELDEDFTDPLGLDPDANGRACEDFFGESDDPNATDQGGGTSSPAPTQSAPEQDEMLKSGGPKRGPVLIMPGGKCLPEYPIKRNGYCYR